MPLPYSKIETNLESKVKKRNIIMDYFVKKNECNLFVRFLYILVNN